jgi:plastocyanin
MRRQQGIHFEGAVAFGLRGHEPFCLWLAAVVGALAVGTTWGSAVGPTSGQEARSTAGHDSKPQDSASTASTGHVAGRVSVPAGQTRPETVVFLESAEGQRAFEAPQRPAVVSQKGAQFSPSLLVICVGQKVEFRNDEDRAIEHNVFSRSPTESFDLGLYSPGISKSVTFEKPGPVRLGCSIHRYMDGIILVCPTPFFAVVGADGEYRIEGVPAGSYRIHTWQRRRRYRDQTQAVSVSAGQTATVDFALSRK